MIDYVFDLLQILLWTISIFLWSLIAGICCALFMFPVLAVVKLFL